MPLHVTPSPSSAVRESLLASRVTGSRYVFLDLAPVKSTRWALALAGREECAPDYLVNRERYPYHVVEYVAAGRGVVRLGGGRAHQIGTGSIYAYGPAMSSWLRSDPEAPLVKFFFALTGKDARTRLAASGLAPGTVRSFAALADVLTIAEEVIHEGRRPSEHAAEICLKLVEIILLRTADAVSHASMEEDRARDNFLRCRAKIETHVAELCSLEEVARAVGLEPESVCRLFRRFQGTSPYQYLLRRKMALAAEFLLKTGGLVKEAAEQVGFEDPYHFSRCFKAVHGVAPSAVRHFATGGVDRLPLPHALTPRAEEASTTS